MGKRFLFLICFVMFISACSQQPEPALIGPNGSWWTGGADGGVYVKIEDDENTLDNIYNGTIYYENDKSVWFKGKFKYSKNASFDYKNKSLYDGWDGEKLYLRDNSYLAAINPPD